MKELVEAFQIFLKYGNPSYPINCQHDIMRVYLDVSFDTIDKNDIKRLIEIGFEYDDDFGCFQSTKYGSN
jgi:hypothetical protein